MEASAAMAWVGRFAGVCLVAAGISFWLAWFLMPLPGTADAAFILEQVGAASASVYASVAVQVVCAALFVPGLAGLILDPRLRDSPGAFFGASLAGVGVTGFAADAIYHLIAYEMSLRGVARDAMLPVMERLQGGDLVFVAPQLGALFIGTGWLAVAAARAGVAPRRAWLELALAPALGLLGALAVVSLGAPRRLVALSALGLYSLAVAELGAALWRPRS